jgi:hypothetical protein
MTKYTAFRCPVDLLAKAQIKAKADRRSLSNFIVTLLEKETADVVVPATAKAPVSKSPKVIAAKAPAPKAKKTAKKA